MIKFLTTFVLFLTVYRLLKHFLLPDPKKQKTETTTPNQAKFDEGEYIDYEEVE